jgi:hypothetical protein
LQSALGYELRNLLDNLTTSKEDDLVKEIDAKYNEYYARYMSKAGAQR